PVERWSPPRETWSLPLASAIVLVASLAVLAGAYSDHLARAARAETSPDALRALHGRRWTQHDTQVLVALAENPHTPGDVLAGLILHPDLRADVARNPATPPDVLERLYALPDVRDSLAVNPSTPPSLLRKLARDDVNVVRSNLLWNPSLPADVVDTLARDPAIGESAVEARHQRSLDRWYLMRPPYTWRWRRPFTRAFDDDAPPEEWLRTQGFDTQEACEALRAEFVRRESSPSRRRVPERIGDQPHDLYAHTRCAFVESGTAPSPTS
ncbi:MAG: hypothetical protein ACREQL_08505, partial [Candidatus Binatia bacterium]